VAPAIALDTSISVRLLHRDHKEHARIARWARHKTLVLTAHSLAETYSVLTRLPGDARYAPDDAARVLEVGFGPTLVLKTATLKRLPRTLAAMGIEGGAVYDALVALAAREHGHVLATADRRALLTYQRIGVDVVTL
jgi:predicted nucleic acid-binding protein